MSFPLFLDEHIDSQLADLLRKEGADVLTTPEARRAALAIPDTDQLDFAFAERRAILTFDTGFIALAEAWYADGKHHAGVIVSQPRTPHQLYEGLQVLFNEHPDGIPDLALWLPRPRPS